MFKPDVVEAFMWGAMAMLLFVIYRHESK